MEKPPNLRFADGKKDCSNCRAYKPKAQVCSMFHDWPVSPELVCNDWEPGDNAPISDDGEES